MKIFGRAAGLIWAALLPGCIALVNPNNAPKPPSIAEFKSGMTAWKQKATQLTAAGMLGASLLFGADINPAQAATKERTTITVTVDTDYLVRALDYFGGDMKKTMTGIVRAPGSTLRIDPPESARDDLLRVLYPFAEPEEYATQVNYLGISVQPKKSIGEVLTNKQFKLGGGVSLSVIDVALVGIAFSYAWGFKTYENERIEEEREAAEKKAAMAAKRAALAAKKEAAANAKAAAASE